MFSHVDIYLIPELLLNTTVPLSTQIYNVLVSVPYRKALFLGSLFYFIDHLSIPKITLFYGATLCILGPLFFKSILEWACQVSVKSVENLIWNSIDSINKSEGNWLSYTESSHQWARFFSPVTRFSSVSS